MPISIAQLQKATRRIEVEYDGQTVGVTYCPGTLTPAYIAGLEGRRLEEQVVELVTAWEITDDTGKDLPVSAELAAGLPLPFLAAITEAINGDLRPNGRRAGS